MTKTDLVKAIAGKSGKTIKDTDIFLNAFIDVTSENLGKGLDVSIIGFGTFSVAERAARQARNFQTGEMMNIPASKTVKFKVGKTLKECLTQKSNTS